jgi:hypothetical protein
MSQLNVDSIKDRTGANQPDIVGAAKAFVNFNGTGTVTIRNGFNVSSITDNGTANYTVNFTNAMVDDNYTATYGAKYSTTSIAGLVCETTGTTRATTSLGIRTSNSTGAQALDLPAVQVAIFR